MANLIQHLTSISPDLRSGPSRGRRLLALTLCSMLVAGSVFPGFALADESDSEGEGTSPSIELPEPPDFDPSGEETDLEEEVPATGDDEDEVGAVEVEPEVDTEAPPPEEVTSAALEPPAESAAPSPAAVPQPTPSASAPEPESAPQAAADPSGSEPVANQSITAPKQTHQRYRASRQAPREPAPPAEPVQREAPPPRPVATASNNSGRNLTGKHLYRVRPGDCLWAIAAELLPPSAANVEIGQEVQRLWRLNASRIGTGDPNLLMAGTELRLR